MQDRLVPVISWLLNTDSSTAADPVPGPPALFPAQPFTGLYIALASVIVVNKPGVAGLFYKHICDSFIN